MRSKASPVIFISFLFLIFLLNCPKRIGIKTIKVEAVYIASIFEDIYRNEPILAGLGDFNGIKIGYLNFESAFMPILMERLGFYRLLNELPIDFVISESPIYGMKYFTVAKAMGYGIKNYQGIRFAIVSKDRDSLTISDETKLALIRERSDVLWVIDRKFFSLAPAKIDFLIKGRELSDTSMTPIKLTMNSDLSSKIKEIRDLVSNSLNKTVQVGNIKLSEYVLARLKSNEGASVVLYPPSVFRTITPKDSYAIYEILSCIACEKKFGKAEMGKSEVEQLVKEKAYLIWGNIAKNNIVVYPDDGGRYLYDLIFE